MSVVADFNYNEYFNKCSTQLSSVKLIKNMLNVFEEYLSTLFIDSIIIKSFYNTTTNTFKFGFILLKHNLNTNIQIMFDIFTRSNIIENKINYNKFIYLLLSATIILYQFIYIIRESLNIGFIKNIENIETKHKNIYNFIFNEFVNSIHADIKKDFESILIYLQYNLQSPVICFQGDYIVLNSYITQIINIMKNYKEISIEDNFITIKQYEGICWFTSFLTGICYSDYNKKLLLDKFDTNKSNYRDIDVDIKDISDPRILLTSFVYNVIKYITYDFKKHKDYKGTKEDCIIQLYLKEMPTKIIISFYNYFLSNPENIPEYFIQLQKRNKKDPLTFEDITNEKISLGMIPEEQVEVFTIFYEFLNIKSLPIYIDTNKQLWILKTDKIDFDIIILYHINNPNDSYIKLDFSIDDINFGSKTININDSIFKLDYLIQGSDSTEECSKFSGCGHCISAIHYNQKEYFHNTAGFQDFKTCNNSMDISITCDLMKKKWEKYLNNPEHIYTADCNYYKIRKNLKLHKFNLPYFKNLFYKITHDVMYCYVKNTENPIMAKEIITGGTIKNKYLINKSNKNIFIIFKNNKKNIIYIKNNKLYLLIDKKPLFIHKKQLSTKNDKYYITI